MRVTIEGVGITSTDIQKWLPEISRSELQYEIIDEGTKSNLAGETSTYLVYVFKYLGDLSVGLISAFIYDIIKAHSCKVKIDGKTLRDSQIEEIKAAILESNKTKGEKDG